MFKSMLKCLSDEAINTSLNDEFDSGCCSDSETSEAIKKYFDNMGEVLCPHSAIGVNVAENDTDRSGKKGPVTSVMGNKIIKK